MMKMTIKRRCNVPCDEGVHKALNDRSHFMQIVYICFVYLINNLSSFFSPPQMWSNLSSFLPFSNVISHFRNICAIFPVNLRSIVTLEEMIECYKIPPKNIIICSLGIQQK